MAAFSSFQQLHPFLIDSLLLPSPDNNTNTSIDTPPYKLSSVFTDLDDHDNDQPPQPFNTTNNNSTCFELNPLCCNNNSISSLDQVALVNSVREVLSQENDSSSAKKQSTATESSSAATAAAASVSHRRRKTRNGSVNPKEERQGGKSKKQKRDKKISEEPPKDYIHVRARRGQATDSHSLAERVRREKISERMRILQKLVPGCDKVTGKALMLDEIINYVQSLQNQVEFLSMKLASLSPVVYNFGVDFDTFMVRPETGPTEGATAFTEPTTAPLFPPLLDNSLLHSHLPMSQGNINDEDEREKFVGQSGLRNNTLCCSFP